MQSVLLVFDDRVQVLTQRGDAWSLQSDYGVDGEYNLFYVRDTAAATTLSEAIQNANALLGFRYALWDLRTLRRNGRSHDELVSMMDHVDDDAAIWLYVWHNWYLLQDLEPDDVSVEFTTRAECDQYMDEHPAPREELESLLCDL